MFVRNLVFVFASLAVLAAPCSGADTTRDSTYSTSDAYAWIHLDGTDVDSDAGAGNTSAHAEVVDVDNHWVAADVICQATTGNTPAVVRVDGYTDSTANMSAGYTDANNDSHMGSLQTFAGFVETNNTVTTAGSLTHYISLSFDTGYANTVGELNAWAKVGNVQVYFSWTGGNKVSVAEHINGSLDSSYDITINSAGKFLYLATFTQNVSVGDKIDVDGYGALVDFENFDLEPKYLTILAGTD